MKSGYREHLWIWTSPGSYLKAIVFRGPWPFQLDPHTDCGGRRFFYLLRRYDRELALYSSILIFPRGGSVHDWLLSRLGWRIVIWKPIFY